MNVENMHGEKIKKTEEDALFVTRERTDRRQRKCNFLLCEKW